MVLISGQVIHLSSGFSLFQSLRSYSRLTCNFKFCQRCKIFAWLPVPFFSNQRKSTQHKQLQKFLKRKNSIGKIFNAHFDSLERDSYMDDLFCSPEAGLCLLVHLPNVRVLDRHQDKPEKTRILSSRLSFRYLREENGEFKPSGVLLQ